MAFIEGVGAVDVEAQVEPSADGFGGAAPVVEKPATGPGAARKIQQKSVVDVNQSVEDLMESEGLRATGIYEINMSSTSERTP